MNRITFLFAFIPLIIFLTSCDDDDRFVGSDRQATETRAVADFDEIRVGDAIAVEVSAGNDFLVTVSGNDNLLGRIETRLAGDRLTIEMMPGRYRNLDVTVSIEMPELNALDLSGASEGELNGLPSAAQEFVLELSGASEATIENASANKLQLGLSGASLARLYGFEVRQAEVNLSGASDASVWVADRISGSLSGASKLHYRGDPTIDVSSSGASEVDNDN